MLRPATLGWGALLLGLLLGSPAAAQVTPAPAGSPAPVVADTLRRPVALTPDPEEPTDKVSSRTGWRIAGVIVAITLTTLLLYNVRSR